MEIRKMHYHSEGMVEIVEPKVSCKLEGKA